MGELGGAAEGYDARDVLGAGAALSFVGASVEEWGELDAFADEEDAGALRRVHLVAGEREQVDVLELTGEVDGELGGGLYGVGVDENLGGVAFGVGLGEAGDLAYGLDCAGLVVGEHDGDEFGVRLEGGFEGCGVDEAVGGGSEVGDFEAAALEGFGGVEDGVVLDLGGDEVGRLFGVQERLQDAGEGQVVALSASGGEDQLLCGAVEELCDGCAGVLDGGSGALAAVMGGAGVAEGFGPEGTHRVDDLG